jgi:1-deoxy-D-xylulose-5-phosphate reductoisomerase
MNAPKNVHGRSVSILGVTGSIGSSTIAVIEELRAQGQDIPVEAVTAGRNLPALIEACRSLKPRFAAVADESLLGPAREALGPLGIKVGAGESALCEAAERPAEWVMSAIVGAAGLKPTLKAIERGALIALDNKETFVCAGALMLRAAEKSGATLLPVDSEHNAIFQCLSEPERVERITLTASGGPFRTWNRQQMSSATPDQACAHPTWSMGAKISVDSATLMNKGLELIEAAYLFGLEEGRIGVLVHPQSIVHSLVHYCDGSVLAQMSAPDMRTPIAYALAWPDRAHVSTARLDLAQLGNLTFEAPDEVRFPALGLARTCLKAGPAHVAAMNAANEVAVEAFLAKRIGFLDIIGLVEEAVAALSASEGKLIAKTPSSFDEVFAIDFAARQTAERIVSRSNT